MKRWNKSFVTILALLSTLHSTCVDSKDGLVREGKTSLLVDMRKATQNKSFGFSSTWEILGPFQIGTREAAWGADPLEVLGGFRNLTLDSGSTFLSSLPIDGVVRWSALEAESVQIENNSSSTNLVVSFPDVQWDFLRTVYGWAAVQYQGWARGYFTITGSEAQPFVLYTDSVLEFWVDDEQFFGGDFYSFRKAPPVLWLEPGQHRLDIRLVRDVRAFGGIGAPTMAIALQLERVSGHLELASDGMQISDLIGHTLAASVASITVRNSGREPIGLSGIRTQDDSFSVTLLEEDATVLPGQTRPVAFNVTVKASNSTELTVLLDHFLIGTNTSTGSLLVNQTLKRKSLYEPHKVTYLHPGGIVSYVILRPPQKYASCNPHDSLPVLLFMHGAGNEAESDAVSRSFDPVPDICSWVLFPTGVTPWSADDWHNWGFADVEAAVAAIETWRLTVDWDGPGVDLKKWFACGHSNGGQGTWYALTHRPDNVIAAAPVSGYLSIQTYVPYHLWRLSDPQLVSVIQASTNSYRHELLISNAYGVDIHQQHGGIDDNVPPYNSRSMHFLLQESGWGSNYTELPGVNHYFDGIMTTPNLQAFYRQQLGPVIGSVGKLDKFTLTVANPGDTESKQGFQILLLQDPGTLGKLNINRSNGIFEITSSNVFRFSIAKGSDSQSVQIDGQSIVPSEKTDRISYYTRGTDGVWKISSNNPADETERSRRQLGPLDGIMRSSGRFAIRYEDTSLHGIALQISRNLHQYYYADAHIQQSFAETNSFSGNMFTVSAGANLPQTSHAQFPIKVDEGGRLSIADATGNLRIFDSQDGIAAIFLRPLKNDALELVVWGSEPQYVGIAARLVPMQTGVSQPDFIVLSRQALWKGVDGVVAAGFFDHRWQVSKTSFFA